ncbi:MAG: VWA domain-containing protein [Candidatus Brocadiae bacterium]|nr:VWA domain-containing protein [Candidatus Brocadiia bacterium]
MPAAGDLSGRSEEYHGLPENPFVPVAGSEPSTFSIDVDTASWTNIRRIVGEGRLPHRDAVRIEEMLNAFRYDDAPPRDGAPFAVSAEVHPAPWNREHRLVRIGLRAKDVDLADAPPANLVFLIDVSGSMADELKLPLVKRCLRLMVDRLREQDKVSLVTYAGVSGLVLEATPGSQKAAILAAIDRLGAGGSTNGAAGIHEAYAAALRHFVKGGINRVLLCTDGDFNVGISTRESLGDLIAAKRETGVFLSVMGFGRGNLADARMQELAEKGNGQAAYIDTFGEGRRVFAEQLTGTLLTVAKDVKIQVEFNAGQAESARLIGYESRMLAAKDFRDDAKDAGEIGAGHQVVALYEVVPAAAASGTSLCTIRLRFKPADGETSSGFECDLDAAGTGKPSAEFDFACAIAACGMLLKDSAHRGTANWGMVQELAEGGIGGDRSGARREFVSIVREMRRIATPQQHVTAPERDR